VTDRKTAAGRGTDRPERSKREAGKRGPGKRASRKREPGMRNADLRATPVASVMGGPPIAVALGSPLAVALQTFAQYGVRHLVVVDSDGRFAGLLTDRAVAAEWARNPLAFERCAVSTVVAADGACVPPHTELSQAAGAMRATGVDAVAVVGPGNEPVGIVTATDLIAAVAGVEGQWPR
jgi:CBS domain-containing protein